MVVAVALIVTAFGLRDAVMGHAVFRERERQVFTDCMTSILDRDEVNYMRMAEMFRRGETPTDDVGGVSYRSVVFALSAVPALDRFGCTGEALDALRSAVLGIRLVVPIAAFGLLVVLGGDGGLYKACLAMGLLAWNSQLTFSSCFLPDVPSALLILLCIAALGLARHPLAAAAAGAFSAFCVLVKSDFLYVLFLVLLVRLVSALRTHRGGARAAVLALVGYLVVLGGWAIRNHSYTGSFFITSKDSVVLWIGNDPEARANGFRYHPVAIPEGIRNAHSGEPIEVWGRKYFYDKLRERILAHPLEVAGGVAAKAWLYLTNGDENNFKTLGSAGVWLGWAVNALALFAALLWSVRRWPGGASPVRDGVVVAWASSFAILAATIYEARYMVHVLALAAVLASWLVIDGARWIRERYAERRSGA